MNNVKALKITASMSRVFDILTTASGIMSVFFLIMAVKEIKTVPRS